MIESQIFSYGASLLTGSNNTLSENEERRKEFFFFFLSGNFARLPFFFDPATLHGFLSFFFFKDLKI
jgi:hypothetical protein